MLLQGKMLEVELDPSGERVEVDLARLRDEVVAFLDLYAEAPLVGAGFRVLVGEGDGEARFERLLAAAGYPDDPDGFLAHLLGALSRAGADRPSTVRIGDVAMPYALLMVAMEALVPGDELFDVKRLDRLERLANMSVPAAERETLARVLELYPVRLSSHVVRQMRLSPAVAYQYLPFADELDRDGLVHTWVGQFHRGVIEQMYRNRVIFILNMTCPVYCRFCFRKHKECRTQRPPTQRHVSLGLQYIRESPDIKEVVLTGGDPFMARPTLTWAVDGLRDVPHVETIRIATRALAYHPALFTAKDGFWIGYLKRKQLELEGKGTRLEVATHFVHPDEVSARSLEVISELTRAGVPVYVQTPLLGGCNDRGPEMAALFRLLRGAGAEMHYIFMPCSPLMGNRRYRAALSDGFAVAAHLRAHLSDRAIPHLCTATAIGKVDWGINGWPVEPAADDPRDLWVRTPYTLDFFSSFAPILDLSRTARVNAEGTLDARFRAAVGDDRWLWGPRASLGFSRAPAVPPGAGPDAADALAALQERALAVTGPARSLVASAPVALSRVHETRVELDCDAGDVELAAALDAIAGDAKVTDVVACCARDPVRSLHRLDAIRERLGRIEQVTALRLRSRLLVARPESYGEGVVRRLAAFNRLEVTRPLRLEVETLLLHPSELSPSVGAAVRALRRHGITVYADIPLLSCLNDDEDTLAAMTSGCRRLGIEVHHLVVAGHPLQTAWNGRHPIRLGDVVALSSALRRRGSGREMPRWIVATPLGEADLGLTTEIAERDPAGVRLRLLAVTPADLRGLDPRWTPPAGVEVAADGRAVVSVPGLLA